MRRPPCAQRVARSKMHLYKGKQKHELPYMPIISPGLCDNQQLHPKSAFHLAGVQGRQPQVKWAAFLECTASEAHMGRMPAAVRENMPPQLRPHATPRMCASSKRGAK
mmetsp:Transcript_88914/g.259884  ORF Transcript_88914/g.259884 Transcript_88914/m.259884 type:complete len:108 (-) Transcript_88914:29-352(-)